MTVQSPIPEFATARQAMVDSQLRPQGVTDPAVLRAMGSIEREKFLPPETRPLAYVDRAVSMGDGRFLSAPAVLGQLLTQMMARPGQRALVIGPGTGYSAEILAAMRLDVTALESSAALASKARELGIEVVQGPLEKGYVAQPSVFFRRDVYDAVGGVDAGLRFVMDYDLWVRFARRGARFATCSSRCRRPAS